jgi:hypothetical protein
MKIPSASKLVFLAMFVAFLAGAPRAVADDINPDADIPDASTLDSSPPNPVLEIPQRCDQAVVAILCSRSSDDSSLSSASADGSDAGGDDSSEFASYPGVGGAYDYANQNVVNEASMGAMNLPMGGYGGGYPVLSPGPTIVSSGPGYYQPYGGPGSYQQWARGPGVYQQWAPGPGYIAPAPLGYHPYGLGGGFGPHPFGGVGGGRFGRR